MKSFKTVIKQMINSHSDFNLMKKFIIPILFISAVLVSCEETIDLDLGQTPSRVVIEGLVTNVEGKNYVRISKSIGFYDVGSSTAINNAIVTIADDQGQQIQFGNSDENGMYLPAPSFSGQVGRTYKLTIQIDNEVYEATDEMMPVTQFDSINYQINKDELDDPNEKGKVYELVMFAPEPHDRKDYYLFKFYRNDSLKIYNTTDIYFSDDTILGERIDALTSPVYFGEGDAAEIQMLSLTRKGYLYYNDLSFLINSDGGMFSPPPANPRTNISNNALGFFQVSAMDTAKLVIK
jgi:hypothetical protein